jgi:hypothetical protein
MTETDGPASEKWRMLILISEQRRQRFSEAMK